MECKLQDVLETFLCSLAHDQQNQVKWFWITLEGVFALELFQHFILETFPGGVLQSHLWGWQSLFATAPGLLSSALGQVHSPTAPSPALSWSSTEVNLWQLLCFVVFVFGTGTRLMQGCHPSVPSCQPPHQSPELLNTHLGSHQMWQSSRVFPSSSVAVTKTGSSTEGLGWEGAPGQLQVGSVAHPAQSRAQAEGVESAREWCWESAHLWAVTFCWLCMLKPFLACARHSLAAGAPHSFLHNKWGFIQTPLGVPLLPTDHMFLLAIVFFPLPYLATFEVISGHTAAYMNFLRILCNSDFFHFHCCWHLLPTLEQDMLLKLLKK